MKKNLSALGITSIIIILICSIISLVLSSIDFNILYARWSSSYYKYLAPCSVASTSFCVFVGLIGLLIFLFNINGLMPIFVFLLLLSTLASWGTAVISIMGGRIKHKNNGSLGCQTELTGVLQIFENIDIYLMYVNSLFCGANCQCQAFDDGSGDEYIINIDENDKVFLNNEFNKEFTSNQKYIFSDGGKTNQFQDCKQLIKDEAKNRYLEHPKAAKYPIDTEKFQKYYKKLEKRFKCTGWCKTAYKDPYTLDNRYIVKYLFSDIRNGLPHHIGCMNKISSWLPHYVMTIGIFMLIASFFETICLLISTLLLGNNEDNNYNDNNFEKDKSEEIN
jgi:hypothetical protein